MCVWGRATRPSAERSEAARWFLSVILSEQDAHEVDVMRSRKPALSEAEGDPIPA
jgi:hypothetical protein